jgi:hypothetical protein
MSSNAKYCFFETSENGWFKVNPLKRSVLYIRNDIISNFDQYKFLTKINVNSSEGIYKLKKYSIFKYAFNLDKNDDIEFSKSLVLQQFDKNCVFKEKSTGILFDNSYDNKALILQRIININTNNNIIVKENECFGIIKDIDTEEDIKDPDIETGNYHIGYVLFKDGDSYVTIEINNFNELNFEFYSDKNTFHNRHKDQYLPNPTSFVLEKDFNYNNELVIYNLNTKLKNIDEYNLKLFHPDNIELTISDENSSHKTSLDLSDDLELEREKEMDNENNNNNEVYGDIEENIDDYEYVVKENKNENMVVSFVKKIKGIFW